MRVAAPKVRPKVAASVPRWDSQSRELWWAGRRLKQFRNSAELQRALLDAFQEAGWPLRIENPLADGDGQDRKTRLQNTVKNINRGLPEGGIRFNMDGTGKAVRWNVDG